MKRALTLIPLAAISLAALAMVVGGTGAVAGEKPLLPDAPEKYKRMRNPVADSVEALQIGERIYKAKCARCHEKGTSGERRAPALDVPEIRTAPPGTLYWILEKGNSDMPSFARFPGRYRWQVVTYLQRRP